MFSFQISIQTHNFCESLQGKFISSEFIIQIYKYHKVKFSYQMSSISNPKIDNTFLVKLVFIGDSGVGKTSLLNRQANDTFTEKHLATIGVDFRVKLYDLGILQIKAQMWDTAGQERFKSIQKPYYRNAKAVCLCFALDDRQSFENLNKWIQELETMNVSKENLFLLGCKSDKDTTIPTDEILVFAQSHGVAYRQTSAKDNEGVNEAFRSIMLSIAEKEIANLRNPNRIVEPQLNNVNMKSKQAGLVKRNCC